MLCVLFYFLFIQRLLRFSIHSSLVSFHFSNLNFRCVSHHTNSCIQTRASSNSVQKKRNCYSGPIKHLIFVASNYTTQLVVHRCVRLFLSFSRLNTFFHKCWRTMPVLSGHKRVIFFCLLHCFPHEWRTWNIAFTNWFTAIHWNMHVNSVFICWSMPIVITNFGLIVKHFMGTLKHWNFFIVRLEN